MKILVLMPLDERSVYMAAGILSKMPSELQDKTFAMPMFMDYLITTKVANSWGAAVFQTIIAARSVYRAAQEKDDLIIIGNINTDYKFDAVFNFQDIDEDEEYKDVFVEKLKEIDDETLSPFITNLYEASASKMPLHNCAATAQFLSDYIKTDPKLTDIEKEYKEKMKEVSNGDTIFS